MNKDLRHEFGQNSIQVLYLYKMTRYKKTVLFNYFEKRGNIYWKVHHI